MLGKTSAAIFALVLATVGFAVPATADHFADSCGGLIDTNCQACMGWNREGCFDHADCTVNFGEELAFLGCHHAY